MAGEASAVGVPSVAWAAEKDVRLRTAVRNEDFALVSRPLDPGLERLERSGRTSEAMRRIEAELAAGDLEPERAARLRVELYRLRRVCQEYSLSREDVLGGLRRRLQGASCDADALLDELMERRLVDWREIDGERRFLPRYLETLERHAREVPGLDASRDPDAKGLVRTLVSMRETCSQARRVTLRATVATRGPVGPDDVVRAWLPLPVECGEQTGVEVFYESTPGSTVSPVTSAQRTIFWEGKGSELALQDGRASFQALYRYTIQVPYVPLYQVAGEAAPGRRQPAPTFEGPEAAPADLAPYLGEKAPHIVFTPFLRALARKVAGERGDALSRARAIYDYVTSNVKYHYQPAYVALDSIADTTARTLTGDCGCMSLLFITLCRIAGVPARWQSGLYVRPQGARPHDWAQFFAGPYGWRWVDCSFGSSAYRTGDELRRTHYFGNLDPLRMIACTDFYEPLTPPDDALRDDPFDNQRGEMSVDGVGLSGCEMERSVEVVDFEKA